MITVWLLLACVVLFGAAFGALGVWLVTLFSITAEAPAGILSGGLALAGVVVGAGVFVLIEVRYHATGR